jgi:hypothetical protein
MPVITALKDAIELLKTVPGAMNLIIDLQTQVMELVAKLRETEEKLHESEKELKRVKSLAATQESLLMEDGQYFVVEIDGKPKKGPYCPKCWHTTEKLCPMIGNPNITGTECIVCRHTSTQSANRPLPWFPQ